MQTARAFIAAKVRLLLSALHVINAWVGLAMAALGHRARRYFCFCLTLLAVWQSVSEAQLKPADDDSKAQGVQLITTIPTCGEDEFLTSNGTHLICRPLPDVGFCDCPDLLLSDAPTVPTPVAPQPPPGCQVFLPPTRGAFVCLRNDDVIYCSVLCDHRFEFSSTPFNPYFCGEETGFNWRDFTGFIHTSFPDCTGFRHRQRTLHSHDFYLPAPCYGLSSNTIRALMYHLQLLLEERGCSKDDCPLENVFLQCPQVAGSVTFFNDIP